ncbi:tRNA(m(1)G37)methyltransferase [Rhizophlyctis rosea]|uniref:tRNA (guanine(37)-N1)-methyltransferase n=1 Tax=Rhizophlyctis rosea TaxID=64517 RepID=A0AAD5SMP9_9FUNG|nr:tRNA(m(1)G37)methyltransferase [Rhizophlyctis rosea]
MTGSTQMEVILPPVHKGLTTLNKDLFKTTLHLVAFRLPPHKCGPAMKALKGGTILELPRLRSIVEDPKDLAAGIDKGAANRLLLLNPSIQEPSIDSLTPAAQEFATKENVELTTYDVDLDYDYWGADQILRSILPDELDVPSSFETAGHIAHLNLRDQYNPYKKIIGEVLLDKCRNLRTVVNKTDSIDHTFRTFRMELLAGDDDMVAELKESNCLLRFDFSKVYWNSRLQGEHDRLVRSFKPGQLICDVMAGVGPFALPAAKNLSCTVFANDLNPESHKWLVENIASNKVGHRVRPYNMDGREFIRQSIIDLNNPDVWRDIDAKAPPKKKQRTSKEQKSQTKLDPPVDPATSSTTADDPSPAKTYKVFNHYVMNLPATAIEFLDAYRGLLHGKEDQVSVADLPIIHCHCFSRAADTRTDVIQRVEAIIKAPLGDNVLDVYDVRNVAPNKEMMCISFRLPAEVAFAAP